MIVKSQILVITEGITPINTLTSPVRNKPTGRKILEFDSSEIKPEINLERP